MKEFIERPANKNSLAKRKLLAGFGINDSDYIVCVKNSNGRTSVCPYYRAWHSMITRCYSSNFHKKNPTYKNCTVSALWVKFTNFKKWMVKQDWKGKQLDKDIKVIGNKLYSPETCVFVTRRINGLLVGRSVAVEGSLTGACFDKRANKVKSYLSINGKNKNIGLFETLEEAHLAYKSCKKKLIEEVASLPENEYIREYLLNHANLLR